MIRTLTIAFVFALVPGHIVLADMSDSPWIMSAGITIPADQKAQITMGPAGCPVIMVNRQAWHIKSMKVVQTLQEGWEIGDYRCLSANGKYFAAFEGTWHSRGKDINVWNLVTGEIVATIPGKSSCIYPVMKIMYNRYLLAAPDTGETLTIWDLEQNKKTRDVLVRTRDIEEGQLTVSPDGKYLALCEGDKVSVMTLADGRYVGNLAAPLRDPTSTTGWTVGARDIKDLEFSPDGQEMAALYSSFSKQRLVVWDGKGQITHDIPLNIPYGRLNAYSLSWLPDQKGWIVDGNVIDRETKKILVQFKRPRNDNDEIAVLDTYFLMGRFGEEAEAITMIGLPWESIDSSLEAMNTVDNAILGPGVKLSLYVYLRGQRSPTVDKARAAIGDAIVNRLKVDKMLYAPDQECFFRFNAEPASPEHQYGQLKLELLEKGSDEPIWSHAISDRAATGFLQGLDKGEISDASASMVASEISQVQIPYFMPRTADFLPLPFVVQ
ncbi:WD40 repeat domain-containing protein [Bremerella sp.]|uniref:WD40 repeat domain-containing protein n=1 Tax=Bremerella sp. TaxID=2795602 RepID=UPI003919E95F